MECAPSPTEERTWCNLRAVRRPQWLTPANLFYLAVAVLASAPAWIVKYPPLQDMPFHAATIRGVHAFGDPTYGFARYFDLSLFSTQYVLYYLLGSALSYLVGVKLANVALICVYLGGTPLAIRQLLGAMGKDARLSILVVPVLVNVMFTFGLMPFVLGIPLVFLGLAAAIRHFERPTRRTAIVLGLLAIALFFSHVFAFFMFGVGFALLFPWGRVSRWLVCAAPVAPSLLLVVWWTKTSRAGQDSFGALKGPLEHAPYASALSGAQQWMLDVFRDDTDEVVLIAFLVLVVAIAGLSSGSVDRTKAVARWYGLLPALCIVLYFVMPGDLGPVWLFSQRFPSLALISLVPALRMPTGARGWVVTAAMLGLAVHSTVNTCKHFIQFQVDEAGDIDGAIAAIAPGKRTAGLIFDSGSRVMNWAPFLHYVSWAQVEKGGLVQFSYADWAHWPFHYKAGQFPPPGTATDAPTRKRWEWTPEQVPTSELYPYYDYVLVRGGGFRPEPGTFHSVFRGERWSVFARD